MVRATRRLSGRPAEASWLRFVLDHAPVILFALDRDGRITLMEGRGLEALDRTPGQDVGRSVFVVWKHEPPIIDNVRRALAGEDFETTTTLSTGKVFSTHFRALRGGKGEPAGTVGVSVDMTQERQALDALRGSEARLR